MPMFKRGNDVADYPESLRGFLTEHGWQAIDEVPAEAAPAESTDEHDEVPAPVEQPEADTETPAVPTTAPAADNTQE